MKGRTRAKTISEYIKLLKEPRKSQIKAIHSMIRKSAPDLKPWLYGNIISYGKYHYKYASGREGDWMVVGLASQKNYISVYICMMEGDEYIPEKYKDDIGKVSVGKSCIRFKKLEDINLKMLEKLIIKAEKVAKKMDFNYVQLKK